MGKSVNIRGLVQQIRHGLDAFKVAEAFDAIQSQFDDMLATTQDLATSIAASTDTSAPGLPGPVSGITAHFEIYLDADKKERGRIVIDSFTPPADQTYYDGNAYYKEDPDASAGTTVSSGSSFSGSTNFSGGSTSGWPIELIARRPYIANEKVLLPGFDPQATARNVRIRINTYSDANGENQLDRATTPSVVVSIPARVEGTAVQGGKGEEYCKNPINPTGNVEYQAPSKSADGIETYRWIGSANDPMDGKAAGYVVYAGSSTSDAKKVTNGIIPLTRTFAGSWQAVPAYTVFNLYFVGVDRNGKENTLQEGVTTKISGIVVEPQTAGGIVGQRTVNIIAASFASTVEPVALYSSNPVSYSGQTIFNTTERKLYRWNGSSYIKVVNSTDVKSELSLDKLVAGQISAGAIGTTELYAGEVLVGQGGGKPTRFKVVNSSGGTIGFIGDDSSIPYCGAYFSTLRIAPNIGSTSPRIEATPSAIALTGCTLSIEDTSSRTTIGIDNTGGIRVTNKSDNSHLDISTAYIQISSGTGTLYTHIAGSLIQIYNSSGTQKWEVNGSVTYVTDVVYALKNGGGYYTMTFSYGQLVGLTY